MAFRIDILWYRTHDVDDSLALPVSDFSAIAFCFADWEWGSGGKELSVASMSSTRGFILSGTLDAKRSLDCTL